MINSEARIKSEPRVNSTEAPIFPRIKIKDEDKFRAVETFQAKGAIRSRLNAQLHRIWR
jgi:hypothetical protein